MKNEYEIRGDTTVIFINHRDGSRTETLIDTEDLGKIKDYDGWYMTGNKQVFCELPDGSRYKMHRIILDAKPNEIVRHKTSVLDNRKRNLSKIKRPCTKSQYTVLSNIAFLDITKMNGDKVRVILDPEDAVKLIDFGYSWVARYQEDIDNYYIYTTININKKKTNLLLHRFLLGAPPDLEVDHIDRNTLNNRRSNLRIVSCIENNHNRKDVHKNTSSGLKGIHQLKNGKWRARLGVNHKRLHLGCFDTFEEAKNAILKAKAVYY